MTNMRTIIITAGCIQIKTETYTISNIKTGDVVLVDPGVLAKAPLVDLSENEQVLLVSPFDVIMIW